VLSADTLIDIAENRPETLYELSLFKGMTPGQLQRHGNAILSAIERGMATPENRLPRFPRTVKKEVLERVKERLKNLKAWRERYSHELGLDPGVLAPNWLLEAIADTESAAKEELATISGMREWQNRLYGENMAHILAMA
jgi:ribonuclease D